MKDCPEKPDTVRRARGSAATDSGWKPVGLGAGVLAIGLTVYLVDRPSWQLAALFQDLFVVGGASFSFGRLGDHLPTFIHVFSLSLICAGLFARSRLGVVLVCGAWWLIDTCFEAFQHPALHGLLAPILASENVVLAEINAFFANGTFDWLDLASIAAGGLSAFCALTLMNKRGETR